MDSSGERHETLERIFHRGNFLRGLHKKFAQRRHERDGAIELGIAASLISPDADELFGSPVSSEEASDMVRFCEMRGRDDGGHDPADTVKDGDRRIVTLGSESAIEHDMAVEDGV